MEVGGALLEENSMVVQDPSDTQKEKLDNLIVYYYFYFYYQNIPFLYPFVILIFQ